MKVNTSAVNNEIKTNNKGFIILTFNKNISPKLTISACTKVIAKKVSPLPK